ncbi:Bug family tripartite tricarboxylate transporter substrate binding protein [Alcaligenes endophyticus]|uniref:Tripartite tricarboxylate transporter substrate binding protein n=1 Tax=Alcaligenes endophyticus TaxID=1929088 RepID=A0ABT8EFP4_9BURK|nr:tripartite tricarboxylate transporter substrate-binding protein [Alcaligenes endophyticus]MCX5590231.1 tripartite tricarboxylate transporter substrate-binding protein [Alcaligenes endophyticus]MDN4120105.1 tripartite tricarboxylate transporter substrate binding protein [Alcaligenes endophyticus]
MIKLIRSIAISCSALSACLGSFSPAHANTWPTKPIRLLVGFAPGGPTDVVARIIAEEMGKELKQPIIVENKAGAAGNIAAAMLKQAPADGYTLLYNTSSIVIAPWVYQQVGFDPLTDFTPIALTAAVPLVLAINPNVNAGSPQELINLLLATPDHYNYASSGTGAIEHLTAAHMLSAVNAKAVHVPYKGTAPAQVDLIAGATQFTTTTLNTAISPVKAGQLKALAVTSKERTPAMPDVPTLSESLIPGFESLAWQGIVAPLGTPTELVTILNNAINKALQTTQVQTKLAQQGTIVLGGSATEYKDYIASEYKRWGEVVEIADVALD